MARLYTAAKPKRSLGRAQLTLPLQAYPERRFFLICLAVAIIGLIPYGVYQFGADLPFWLSVILLPLSECGHYMAVLFHESGHAATYWLFGIPAAPAVDFKYGGGGTYTFGTSKALLAGIYGMMLGAGYLLAHKRKWTWLATLAVFAMLHAVIVWKDWEPTIGVVMGHGAEILTACWCLCRAYDQKTPHSKPERAVSLVFALHLLGRTLLLPAALLIEHSRRITYGVQKGGLVAGDLVVFSERLGIGLDTAAVFLVIVTIAALAFTLRHLYKLRKLQA